MSSKDEKLKIEPVVPVVDPGTEERPSRGNEPPRKKALLDLAGGGKGRGGGGGDEMGGSGSSGHGGGGDDGSRYPRDRRGFWRRNALLAILMSLVALVTGVAIWWGAFQDTRIHKNIGQSLDFYYLDSHPHSSEPKRVDIRAIKGGFVVSSVLVLNEDCITLQIRREGVNESYEHLLVKASVQTGDFVKAGDVIGQRYQ